MNNQPIDPRLEDIIDCIYRVSAKAIIIKNNKILLTQEKEKWWSLPGGGVDYGEVISDALKRELSEELSVAPDKVIVHNQILQAVTGSIVDQVPRIALIYQAELLTDNIEKTDHVLSYGWFTAKDLGQLYVSPTVGGITELLKHLSH